MSQPSPDERAEMYQLALEYARAADRRDYEAFRKVLTEDGVISVHDGDPETAPAVHEMKGHDVIVKAMRSLAQYAKTMHVVSNQYLDVEGDRASGETYCVAHHLYDKNGVTYDHTMHIRYQDRYARVDGRWLFSERRLWTDFHTQRPLVIE